MNLKDAGLTDNEGKVYTSLLEYESKSVQALCSLINIAAQLWAVFLK